jgi:hypothetical protein
MTDGDGIESENCSGHWRPACRKQTRGDRPLVRTLPLPEVIVP